MLTHDQVIAAFDYDPKAGIFRHRKNGNLAGSMNNRGYWRLVVNKKTYSAHRVAWLYVHGVWPDKCVDHINGIKTDNRLSNLRLADTSQNTCNSRLYRSNTSGKKGVTWHKTGRKWQAHIKVNGKTIYLGLFDSIDAAHAAYCTASKTYHGQFGRTE